MKKTKPPAKVAKPPAQKPSEANQKRKKIQEMTSDNGDSEMADEEKNELEFKLEFT